MRATSHAYGIVAGDENGLVASTTPPILGAAG
jgi:hypothetical protein